MVEILLYIRTRIYHPSHSLFDLTMVCHSSSFWTDPSLQSHYAMNTLPLELGKILWFSKWFTIVRDCLRYAPCSKTEMTLVTKASFKGSWHCSLIFAICGRSCHLLQKIYAATLRRGCPIQLPELNYPFRVNPVIHQPIRDSQIFSQSIRAHQLGFGRQNCDHPSYS